MNDGASHGTVDPGADTTPGGSPLREPLTIADAARRAGVHPNTIRRLIRQGRVAARMVRGRYGDTWLVESSDIDRAVGAESRGAPEWEARGAPTPLISEVTDLSLDRARALERYTHGLLQPLVDLLREREAAVESRDTLIRTQAERIGRLERELELLRAGRLIAVAAAGVAPAQAAPEPGRASQPTPESPAAQQDDLPAHVSTLASQVGRLRAELQLIAIAFNDRDSTAPPEAGPDPEPTLSEPELRAAAAEEEMAAAAASPIERPDTPAVPNSTSAITPEELASLFPSTTRGRLTLDPLEPLSPLDAGDSSTPGTDQTPSLNGAPPDTGTPLANGEAHGRPADASADPFAQAEAAVQELRRVLAPAPPAATESTPVNQTASGAPTTPSSTPAGQSPEPRPRRWWWPW